MIASFLLNTVKMPKIVDHDARRKDFIEAAYQSILEDGLAETTVRSVAKRAGYTTGALVHYFAAKDDLIRHVLEANGVSVRERMVLAQKSLKGRVALMEVLREALPISKLSRSSWRIWLALWYHSEKSAAMRTEERRKYKEWIGRISEILEQSVTIGELPSSTNIEDEARSLVAFVDGLGVQYLMANGRMTARHLIHLVDNYLDRLYR
jgi:AcrR family transcriptional regulator